MQIYAFFRFHYYKPHNFLATLAVFIQKKTSNLYVELFPTIPQSGLFALFIKKTTL